MASTPTIVLVDSHIFDFGDQFAGERAAWEALGATVKLARCDSEDDIIAACGDADILAYVGLYTPFTPRVMAALPKCQLIARYGIGMDSVDLEAATAHGIVASNAAEYCVPEVGDHATALILALARHVPMLDRFVRAGRWAGATTQFAPTIRLGVQSVGFVGFGRIARHAASNLRAMFGTLLAYDPYVTQEQADDFGVTMLPLDEVLAQADYVSVHTPLMPQTRGLIGAAELAKMKSTACLVNTSRGPVVDEAALVEALQKKQIAGAALDVFDPEPLAEDSPLRDMENVILTPHTASYSEEAIVDLRAAVTQTVSDVLQGYLPRHILNRGVAARFGLKPRQ